MSVDFWAYLLPSCRYCGCSRLKTLKIYYHFFIFCILGMSWGYKNQPNMHIQVICVNLPSTVHDRCFFSLFSYISANNTFQYLVLPSCYANCDTVCTVQRFWLQGYWKALRKPPSSIQTNSELIILDISFPCPIGFITRDSSLMTLPSDLENHIPPSQLSSVKNFLRSKQCKGQCFLCACSFNVH